MLGKLLTKDKKDISADGILILYGTKTGNAKIVAKELNKQLKKMDLNPATFEMKKVNPEILSKYSRAFFIVSTHDEGEPPASARKFFKSLLHSDMKTLENLNYSICGLGDSSYEQFCEASKILDERLKELNANSISPRVECDIDYGKDAGIWIKSILGEFTDKKKSNKTDQSLSITSDTKNIYTGILSASNKLSVSSNGNETYHIEITKFNQSCIFNPGDLIEITPQNPLWMIEDIASLLNTNDYNSELLHSLELCKLSAATIKSYALIAKNDNLNRLILKSNNFSSLIRHANILDLLTDFPGNFTAEEFINVLPKLKGRQYSVANFQSKINNKLHLMIKTVRYDYKNRNHEGAASVYTNEKIEVGSNITFKHIANPDYYLTSDKKTPLILIGTGTGFAPLRAYIQQWNKQKYKSKIWLIWGEQNHNASNKYIDELKKLQSKNKLLRADCVSSRGKGEKVYVQDIIQSKPKKIKRWINKGAQIYVCGSQKMGFDVENSIESIIMNDSLSIETLKESNKYISSVY